MRRPLITVTVAVVVVLAGVSGSRQQLSSGEEQDPKLRDQPACTIYCSDSSSDTVKFADQPCWGGPLPAGQAGDRYQNLAPDAKERACATLTDPNSHNNRECPVFKTLAALCEKDKLPKDKLPKDKPPEKKCDPPRDRNPAPPWLNPDSGCQNRQRATYSWGQRGGNQHVTVSICGRVIRFIGIGIERERTGARSFEVCCNSWEDAIDSGSPCNPLQNIDCDRKLNENDINPISFESLAPRSDDFVSNSPLAHIPFWKKLHEGMPRQSGCKDCKWELVGLQYACEEKVTQTGRRSERVDANYDYKATWKCPATGQTEVTDESATMQGLHCPTPPNRSWP